jgi:hypothetical protein
MGSETLGGTSVGGVGEEQLAMINAKMTIKLNVRKRMEPPDFY